MKFFQKCSRCGSWSVECLATHSHCWECNYFPEESDGLREWRRLEFRNPQRASSHRREDTCLLDRKTYLSIAAMRNFL